MLYREIIVVCSEILTKQVHCVGRTYRAVNTLTKHTSTLCGQNVPRCKHPYKTHQYTVWAERTAL